VKRISRRTVLRSALTGSAGLLAAYTVGCGDDAPAPQTSPTDRPTPAHTGGATQPPPSAELRWTPVEVAGGLRPPPRHDHSLVTNGRSLVLFGGRTTETFGDLWIYDFTTGAWEQIASGSGPAPRFGHNAAFDSSSDRILIFGGQAGGGFFNDLWAFNMGDGSWTQITQHDAPVPSRRYGAASAIDPSGRFMVSHGFTDAGRFDDSWSFASAGGTAWIDVSPSGERPVERCLMRGVYDSAGKRFLMFGGQTNAAPFLGDLWVLGESGWTEISAEPKPSPRNFYSWTYDEQSRAAILFGGRTEGGASSELWAFDLSSDTWSALAPEGAPPSPRFGHDAAWLPESRRLIVFGGRDDSGDLNDLWQLTVPA